MPEVVTYKEAENLIVVKSTGQLTFEEVRTSILAVHEISKDTGARNVLVDQLEASSFPSAGEGFNLGTDIALRLKTMNIAIVHSREIEQDVEFFEKVIKVRGGNLRVFRTMQSAKDWFEEQNKS